jgi:predicted outer membrane repeat protein
MGLVNPTPDLRDQSFDLKAGVVIYGGFRGEETGQSAAQGRDARETTTPGGDEFKHPSILSGRFPNDQRAYHVVTARNLTGPDTPELHDLQIRDGKATGPDAGGTNGGGLYCLGSDLTLEGVTFADNTSLGYGGGVYIEKPSGSATSPIIKMNRISFRNNLATGMGGGLYMTNPGFFAEWTNLEFVENSCPNGAAIRISSSPGGSLMLNNAVFRENLAAASGGILAEANGYIVDFGTNPTDVKVVFTNVEFTGNSGIVTYLYSSSSMVLINGKFENNNRNLLLYGADFYGINMLLYSQVPNGGVLTFSGTTGHLINMTNMAQTGIIGGINGANLTIKNSVLWNDYATPPNPVLPYTYTLNLDSSSTYGITVNVANSLVKNAGTPGPHYGQFPNVIVTTDPLTGTNPDTYAYTAPSFKPGMSVYYELFPGVRMGDTYSADSSGIRYTLTFAEAFHGNPVKADQKDNIFNNDYSLKGLGVNAGDNSAYPNTAAELIDLGTGKLAWLSAPAYTTVREWIDDALQKDVNGNPRKNGTIDMGAYEQ